ncbi:MAG: DUF2807 domain-containing protein [Alistipes sp.]|nr:DUF2807 domain-containing protein [Alistipes sp.]
MKHHRLIYLLVALFSVSCIGVYRADGPVESRSVMLTGGATAIAISHGVDVVVDATLPMNEVRITTHSDVVDFVKAYVEEQTLYIKLDAPRAISTNTLEVHIPKFDYSSLAISAGAEFSDRGYGGAELVIAASAGAEVDIAGEVDTLIVAASAGADLSLDELCVKQATISASAGAEVDVYATESLVANVSAGADVSYKGNPQNVEVSTSAGGSVEHDND